MFFFLSPDRKSWVVCWALEWVDCFLFESTVESVEEVLEVATDFLFLEAETKISDLQKSDEDVKDALVIDLAVPENEVLGFHRMNDLVDLFFEL